MAREGAPLETEWSVGGVTVAVQSEAPLGSARNRPMTQEFVAEQLGRLGNTAYELAELTLEVSGAPFAPSSLLNQLRREAVERLEARQSAPREIAIHEAAISAPAPVADSATGDPRLHLLVRDAAQLEAAIEFRPASITLDYLDLYGLRPSIERVREAGLTVRVASPRVLKPGEERIVEFLLGCDCAVLVRSGGLLHALAGRPHPVLVGDFSLNAANAIAAEELFAQGLDVPDPHARSERRAGGGPCAGGRGAPLRSGGVSAPARVPHRALRLLPVPLEGHELPGLRPAL